MLSGAFSFEFLKHFDLQKFSTNCANLLSASESNISSPPAHVMIASKLRCIMGYIKNGL